MLKNGIMILVAVLLASDIAATLAYRSTLRERADQINMTNQVLRDCADNSKP